MSGVRGWIMVVDDDDDIRETIGIVLGQEGYPVVGASDGLDAFAYLRAHPDAALIVLDLMMPRLSGVDLLRLLRADPALAEIPVLVMSGDTGARDTAASLGVHTCLTKPMDLDELVAAVEHVAAHRGYDELGGGH